MSRVAHPGHSLDYRIKWDEAFLSYIKGLEAKKPVVWCGDLNVSRAVTRVTRADVSI